MINYLKSEVYRNIRSKTNYVFLFGSMGFVILINVALGIYANGQVDFPYGNTRFSFLSFFTAMGVPMILCFVLVSIVNGQEFKYHTLKNSISYGISRSQIYFSKFLMEIIISLINLICISGAYIISAYTMLENSGIVYLNDLFRALIACVPLFVVSVMVAHCLYYMLDSEITVGVVWAILIIVIPQVLAMAGRGILIFRKIASWMPWNIIGSSSYDEVTRRMVMIWSSQEGLIKCFIVGIMGSVIFYVLGLELFKRREIK